MLSRPGTLANQAAAHPRAGLVDAHSVSVEGGGPCELEARKPGADDADVPRPSSACVRPRLGKRTFGCLRRVEAPDGPQGMDLVPAEVAVHARTRLLTGEVLVDEIRLGQERTRHGHEIGITGVDEQLGEAQIGDIADCHHRNATGDVAYAPPQVAGVTTVEAHIRRVPLEAGTEVPLAHREIVGRSYGDDVTDELLCAREINPVWNSLVGADLQTDHEVITAEVTHALDDPRDEPGAVGRASAVLVLTPVRPR